MLTIDSATGKFSGTPVYEVSNGGVYTIRVTVSDGQGGSTSENTKFTVLNQPDAPVYTGGAIATQSASQNSLFSLQLATFTDVDPNASLSYSATLSDGSALPAWLSFNSATRTFSGTPTNSDNGTLQIKVSATDNTVGAAYPSPVPDSLKTTTVAFDINVNHVPTSTGIVTQGFTEDAFQTLKIATPFSDDDASDTLTYTATQADGSALPAWLSYHTESTTAAVVDDQLVFEGTPRNPDVGAIDIKVTANDGHGGVTSSTFPLIVANTNDAPQLDNTVPDTTATEGDSTFSYSIGLGADYFSDADVGDTLTYSAEDADGGVLPSWLVFDTSTGTFSGTPELEPLPALDEVNVRVTATDLAGEITFDAFKISITHVNNDPTGAVTIDGTVAEGEVLTANTSTLDDQDGVGTLHYQWQVNDGTGWTNVGADSATFTPDNAMAKAQDNVQVIVSYTDTRAANESVTSASVGPVVLVDNQPTGAVTVSNMTDSSRGVTTAQQNDVLTVSNTLVDADGIIGSVVSYQWLRNGVAVAGETGTSYTLTQDDVGMAITVKASYTDNDNFADEKTSAATNNIVNVNDAPVLDNVLDNQVASTGSLFTYDIQAAGNAAFSDVDLPFGDNLHFSATVGSNKPLPSWLSIDANTGLLSGVPTISDIRIMNIKVKAMDDAGEYETDFMRLKVEQGVTLVDAQPTGSVTVAGTAELAVLSADVSGIADTNGLNGVAFSYQWQQSTNNGATWSAIAGMTSSTYTPDDTMADGGKSVRVLVSYTDQAGFADSIASAALKLTDIQDTYVGTASANKATGSTVIDIMSGLAGNDTLDGALGNDSLSGGEGLDNLNGGDGNDILNGDAANDILTGGTGNDTVNGGAGNDAIFAAAGSDMIDGGLGVDTANYASSADAINVDLTNAAPQIVSASSGTDTITGIENVIAGAFADTLKGDANANTFTSGLGNDTLTGGAGADRFIFNTATGPNNVDTITDFTSGSDLIGLSKTIFTAYSNTAINTKVGLGVNLAYTPATGAVTYDFDGSGSTPAVTIAILGSAIHPAALGTDFIITA